MLPFSFLVMNITSLNRNHVNDVNRGIIFLNCEYSLVVLMNCQLEIYV